ncbi:MAG: DegT/DnrJ/EryC1/StrS aminotransferase family protein [Candidatus Norongarragalinales archaeon]
MKMISIAKPLVSSEEIEAAKRALESGMLTGGPLVEEFEKKLAEYCNYKHAIAVNSGTAALHVAAAALGIKQGDCIITPDFTFIATANTARYLNATPLFADVDSKTFNIDARSLNEVAKKNKNVKAIIPVSLYGQAYAVDEVKEVAEKFSLKIISDNAQAIGTEWNGNRNFGDHCAVLSFYPTKNITTCEGGAVLTDDPAIAEECRLWRNIGQRKPYDYVHLGYNFRLNAVSAAIGIEQLKKLDAITEKRRANARVMNELLQGVEGVETPFEHANAKHVYNQYTIRVKGGKRDALKEFLAKSQVGSAVYYPTPLSGLETFKQYSQGVDNKVAAELSGQVLSLPIHPGVSEENLKFIAAKIKEFLR